MTREKDINTTNVDENREESRDSWNSILQKKLRDELIPEVTDEEIMEAIEQYRRFILSHMLKAGEISRLISGSSFQFSRVVWRRTLAQPLYQENITLDELDVDIPLPDNELYNDIVVGIWKRVVKDPTWSLEFSLGSKSIRRDRRNKSNSDGLLIQELVLIYYYANDFGCFGHCNSEKAKIESFILKHEIDTTYDSFKKVLSKFFRVKER